MVPPGIVCYSSTELFMFFSYESYGFLFFSLPETSVIFLCSAQGLFGLARVWHLEVPFSRVVDVPVSTGAFNGTVDLLIWQLIMSDMIK